MPRRKPKKSQARKRKIPKVDLARKLRRERAERNALQRIFRDGRMGKLQSL